MLDLSPQIGSGRDDLVLAELHAHKVLRIDVYVQQPCRPADAAIVVLTNLPEQTALQQWGTQPGQRPRRKLKPTGYRRPGNGTSSENFDSHRQGSIRRSDRPR
ncbi:hypothetical protein NCCP2145_31380 [Pseudarthrobacter sp. NCCP-2145]|nr:hypothetical protein GCM10017547_42110 [Pseudarthrobacter oxydans]GKV73757.1 hypothetical protein NCCP2145_31380 [Pseudarthrobacter sp. NCCP-2145]